MVTIDLANDLTAGAHTIAITDIQNPTAQSPVAPNLIVRTVDTNAFVEKFTFSMPAMVPGSYDALDMTIEPILLNCPYSTYLFEFTTSKEIPEGASISITFPTPAYSFPAYTDCGEITGLEGKILN